MHLKVLNLVHVHVHITCRIQKSCQNSSKFSTTCIIRIPGTFKEKYVNLLVLDLYSIYLATKFSTYFQVAEHHHARHQQIEISLSARCYFFFIYTFKYIKKHTSTFRYLKVIVHVVASTSSYVYSRMMTMYIYYFKIVHVLI